MGSSNRIIFEIHRLNVCSIFFERAWADGVKINSCTTDELKMAQYWRIFTLNFMLFFPIYLLLTILSKLNTKKWRMLKEIVRLVTVYVRESLNMCHAYSIYKTLLGVSDFVVRTQLLLLTPSARSLRKNIYWTMKLEGIYAENVRMK